MTDKLTDAEIKKALECCTIKHDCNECPYKVDKCKVLNGVLSDALDLINRQEEENRHLDQESDILRADVENLNRINDELNAENESLKAEVESLKEEVKKEQLYNLRMTAYSVKAEAYKEFAEKLKDEYTERFLVSGDILIETIDNILNELVGDA